MWISIIKDSAFSPLREFNTYSSKTETTTLIFFYLQLKIKN